MPATEPATVTASQPYIRPDMKAFLEMLAGIGGPKMADMTIDHARAGYGALHRMADRPARELAVIRDLACPGPAGEIALRLYDKREAREPGPVIVFFHGGGFVIGDLETHHSLCSEIAWQLDMPLLAVDYRRAPEHPFPAAIEDCEAAARWIAGSPPALGREATSLVTIGDSAGGCASIVVSQAFAARPAAVPVVLQVPIFPATSDVFATASIDQFGEGYLLTRATMEFFDAAYAATPGDPRAFPILGRHQGTPPSVVVTASLDPIRDSGRDYAATLSAAGIDHVFIEIEGVTHSFVNLRQAVPSAQRDVERICAAMKLMLEHGA